MTKNGPAAPNRWAVSTRTHGEVLTASVTLPSIQLILLGIPQGFTPVEIQSWLRDLAGVAIETSRADQRTRPIPALLHHALTGLLFSQSELWSHTGYPLPCAAVFVDGPAGVAFGWVGRARVVLLVNGEPFEPQWVIVRDEAKHEAMSASLAADAHVLLTLEYWPQGEDGSQAPASVDAECGHALAAEAGEPPAVEAESAEPVAVEPDASPTLGVLSSWSATPLAADPRSAVRAPGASSSASLPTQQPGLAPPPSRVALDRPDTAQSLPSTYHPSSATFSMPQVPGLPASPLWAPEGTEMQEPERTSEPAAGEQEAEGDSSAEPGHPVGRWLSRLLGYGKKAWPREAPPPVAPLSRYDALLSPEETPAADFSEPPSDASASRGSPTGPTLRAGTPIDIEEPHALPASAGGALAPSAAPAAPAAPIAPSAPPGRGTRAERGSGLASAGLSEILGSMGLSSAPPATPQMEGLTAVSAASGPIEPPAGTQFPPHPGSPGTPPYPMLEVTPPPSRETGPIQIEREPVAPDPAFGIPRLPQRPAGPALRASAPPAPEPSIGRDAAAGPMPRAGTPPASATSPAVAGKPRPPQAPVLATPRGVPTRSVGPPAAPPVPEPPVEFLAEFEASLHVEPVMDPTLPPWQLEAPAAAPQHPQVSQPPALPPGLRGTQPPGWVAQPPASPPAVTPATPRPGPTLRAGTPPTLRAATPPAREAAPPPPVAPPSRPAQTAPAPRPVAPAMRAAPQPASTPPPIAGRPVLRAPTVREPEPLAEADVAALMRELPLHSMPDEVAEEGAQGGEYDDIPDGMLVAQPASGLPRVARARLSSWPAPDELEVPRSPAWRNPWAVLAFISVLFGVGWLVGHSQAPDNDVHGTPISRVLRTVGLGGARFNVSVDSDPPGAWIAVDGKDAARRTPSTIELAPGDHVITLSMPDLGSVKVPVKGARGQKVKVNEALHGSLDITALDPAVPVKLSLDGQPEGWLPVHIDKLPPGLHEVQFSGPNMQPWGQNVNIGIRQTTQIVAKQMTSPATGVVQVQASLNDDNGTAPLSGANVFVDGELRGSTPLTIELPRGPHSLKVTHRGEAAPVQVIDLPGGNQRFASFQFGLDSDLPPLRLQGSYAVIPPKRATAVVASLDGLDAGDVREAWLHVRTPDGLWRRYEMTVAPGPRGATLSAVFPLDMLDAQGRATWYLSAATGQGDEFFTEIQRTGH